MKKIRADVAQLDRAFAFSGEVAGLKSDALLYHY